MQSIDNVLKLRKGLKPDDPNPDIFDVLWAKKLSGVAKEYTITGNPLSFLAKKAQTAKSTKVTLEPIQDLHGYDNPWPAGGGKNKFSGELYQADSTINTSDGTIISNSDYDVYILPTLAVGDYALSVLDSSDVSAVAKRAASYDTNDNLVGEVYAGNHTPSTTVRKGKIFTVPSGISYTLCSVRKTSYDIMVESGSTITDYVPYSNICPISGRSSVEIKGCGKNLVFSKLNNTTIDVNGIITYSASNNGYIARIKKDETYSISVNGVGKAGYLGEFVTMPQSGSVSVNESRVNKRTFTATIDGYVFFRYPTDDTNIQCELGSEATTYESYQQSNDVTISFGETVYGGTLNVETGTLKVNKFRFVFDSAERIEAIKRVPVSGIPVRNFYRYIKSNGEAVSPSLLQYGSSHYKADTINTQTSITGCYIYTSSSDTGKIYIQFRDNDKYTDLETCKQWFTDQLNNGTPVEVWYTVTDDYATTIQLTPEQIQILKGQNTIWIEDVGATIALTYKN